MPTYETLTRFNNDLRRLTPEQRRRFRRRGRLRPRPADPDGLFRAGLRIKQVSGFPGIYELTWSMGTGPEGRATFEYGTEVRPGTPHVIWRRIGTHSILTGP
ncbi:hypothetical protein LT966_28630 [Streptomyces griseobrunneus]|uniref:hypothetical protein n=1 Tax=Streptomyces rhizosphaericola TaxID=2564098 RepID=UPI0038966113